MAYRIGTVNGHHNALLMLKRFLESGQYVTNIVYTPGNTGDGYISAEGADDAAPDETWTITLTAATTFDVSGSVSGANAGGTVGTVYTSDAGEVTFTLEAGLTAWSAVGPDTILFDVAAGLDTDKWTVDDFDDSEINGSPNKQLLLNAPGLGAGEDIYMAIDTYTDAGNSIYTLQLYGNTGYNAAANFLDQPGNSAPAPRILMQNREMKYWVVANGRRVMGVFEVGGVYEWFHMGFLLPYGLPNENPYPLMIGGSIRALDYIYTSDSYYHAAFFDSSTLTGVYTEDASGRVFDGNWFPVANRYADTYDAYAVNTFIIWPWNTRGLLESNQISGTKFLTWLRPNFDDSYPMLPAIVWKNASTKRTIGQIQGLFATSGSGVNSEDEFLVGGITYKIFQNTHRTGYRDWAVLKLE